MDRGEGTAVGTSAFEHIVKPAKQASHQGVCIVGYVPRLGSGPAVRRGGTRPELGRRGPTFLHRFTQLDEMLVPAGIVTAEAVEHIDLDALKSVMDQLEHCALGNR